MGMKIVRLDDWEIEVVIHLVISVNNEISNVGTKDSDQCCDGFVDISVA